MSKHRQAGFTLVELMVAMLIGTVIILGAGNLFLSTFQTFQKVGELSRKQEVIVFATSTLTNEYRKDNAEYELAPTVDEDGNELDDCSIRNSDKQPVIGGLAKFADSSGGYECASSRFIDDNIKFAGEKLDGYRKFTLDFEKDNGEMETLSFHVMERNEAMRSDPGSESYKVGTGDAIIAGDAVNNVGENLLAEESKYGENLNSENIPDPKAIGENGSPGYINDLKAMSFVEDLGEQCDVSSIASSESSVFYCRRNINNLDTVGLDNKIIIAEDGIGFNLNSDVKDLVIVAGGTINAGGGGSSFSGIIWSGENIALNASGADYIGVVIARNGVSQNNTSSITSDWNALDLLSVPGYEFSMYEQFKKMGILEQLHEAERN